MNQDGLYTHLNQVHNVKRQFKHLPVVGQNGQVDERVAITTTKPSSRRSQLPETSPKEAHIQDMDPIDTSREGQEQGNDSEAQAEQEDQQGGAGQPHESGHQVTPRGLGDTVQKEQQVSVDTPPVQ